MKQEYEDPGRNVRVFAEVFDAEGVDWCVIGGLAAVEAGVPGRETADGMHFDMYVASIPFENEVLATKSRSHVASPEALVVYKLLAERPRDVEDVRSILGGHPGLDALDADFIARWAAELGVLDRWRRYSAEERRNRRGER